MKTPKKKTRKKLTDEDKTNYMRIGLGMMDVSVRGKIVPEIIWRLYEGMQKLGGEFSLKDAAAIRAFVENKYPKEDENEWMKLQKEQYEILKELQKIMMAKNAGK